MRSLRGGFKSHDVSLSHVYIKNQTSAPDRIDVSKAHKNNIAHYTDKML